MLESKQYQDHNQSINVIAGVSCTLDAVTILDCMQLLICTQVTVAINAVKLQLCVLKQNSKLCTQMT